MLNKNQITSRNEEWGFFGTVIRNSDETITHREATILFDSWVRHIARDRKVTTTVARDYLDSKCGRHFADALCDVDGKPSHDSPKWFAKDFRRFFKEYDAAEFPESVS